MRADRIMRAIEELELRVPGARLVYEILCEFLHPNIGDLWGATLTGKSLSDGHGTRHLVRMIGFGSKTLKALFQSMV